MEPELGIVELVSAALGQHAGGAIKISEIGARQRLREVLADPSRQGGHEDQKKKTRRIREEGSSRRGMIPVIMLICVASG
jgi:hypothetical protein